MDNPLWPRLLFAHLLGDFALQTDAVYQLKTTRKSGLLLHAGITTACLLACAFPYLGSPAVLLGLLVLGLTHLGLDGLKLSSPAKNAEGLFFFLLDQVLHVGLIFAFCLLPSTRAPRGMDLPIYGNTQFFVVFSLLLAASFGLNLLLLAIDHTFLHTRPGRRLPERYWDFFWRTASSLLVLAGRPFWYFAPAGLLLGLVTNWPNRKERITGLLVGFGGAVLLGFAFRSFL